jgi:hypothetical protein
MNLRKDRRPPSRYRTKASDDSDNEEELYATKQKKDREPSSVLEVNDVNYCLLLAEYRENKAKEAASASKKKATPTTRKRKRKTARLTSRKRKKPNTSTTSSAVAEEPAEEEEPPLEQPRSTTAKRVQEENFEEEEEEELSENEEEAATTLTSFVPRTAAQLESARFASELEETKKRRLQEQYETEELCWMGYKGLCTTADHLAGGDGSFEEVLEETPDIKKMFTICLRKDKDKVEELVENYSWWGLAAFTGITWMAVYNARNAIKEATETQSQTQKISVGPPISQQPPPKQQQHQGHFSDSINGTVV